MSWNLAAGEVLAIVGESGAGKSATAWALLGLLPRSARVRGSVRLGGQELLGLGAADLDRLRGARLAIVPQAPLSSLNPVHPLGRQVADAVRAHDRRASPRAARARALELLALVGMPDASGRARAYPHELSGGMRQRAVIAMALAHDPEVIIADEPTSALDVTVQAEILDTLRAGRERTGAAMVLITHDLGAVAGHADRVLVMHDGRAVESGPAGTVLVEPASGYTATLVRATPR
ncbi:MAG TPA: ABC transporter ATP-binding protein, partial [Acidimicrobiales bacterium]|nr:ABC transporter ATP-binding protein [Acidimicrobiales bacterium]